MVKANGAWAYALLVCGCGNSAAGESADGSKSGDAGSTDGDEASASADGGSTSNDGSGANGGAGAPVGTGARDGAETFTLPPGNGGFDYQIGGGYAPPNGVVVLSRDREDEPAAGVYNICYVNGFQTQPEEGDWWLKEHPDLILHDGGDPVLDQDWGEMLLDTSTSTKRDALAVIIGGWIRGCADSGFDALEIDNLDTYSRSANLLSQDDNVAFMALLSKIAHDSGLASGQKNSSEILGRVKEMGTDFAVAEECNRWDECGDYQDIYGDLVFIIEYRDQDFKKGCTDFPELSIVRRDLNVEPKGATGYVYDAC